MNFIERLDNVYTIDTNMFEFKKYCAAYLVKGNKLALIDSGMASQTKALSDGINAWGFAISDIDYIFITHSHADHIGNVAKMLKQNSRASVYVHPEALELLTNPEIENQRRAAVYPQSMASKFGIIEPTSPSRIRVLHDGEVFDLGDGETLRVIFTPGHQPNGIVLFEKKHKGLFINDLVGNYFADANSHYTLNPLRSDHLQAIKSLEILMDLPVENLYLGHYGIITEKPKELMSRAINNMRRLLDIGTQCMAEGKPENIVDKLWEVYMPELQKLRAARGDGVYQYAVTEHLPSQFETVAKNYKEQLQK